MPATKVAELLPKIPALVRHPVRCGKPNCRCAHGQLHEAWRLYWRGPNGRQRFRHVPKVELDAVRAILAERRHQRMLDRLTLRFGRERVRRLEQWLREHETNRS